MTNFVVRICTMTLYFDNYLSSTLLVGEWVLGELEPVPSGPLAAAAASTESRLVDELFGDIGNGERLVVGVPLPELSDR
jgi:hypothetical protein